MIIRLIERNSENKSYYHSYIYIYIYIYIKHEYIINSTIMYNKPFIMDMRS